MNRLYLSSELAASLSRAFGFRLLHAYQNMSLVECRDLPDSLPAQSYTLINTINIVVNGNDVSIPDGSVVFSDTPRHLVRFIGPVATEWLVTLNQSQIKVWFMCPPYGACVEIPALLQHDNFLEQLPFIAGVVPYQEEQCTRAILKPSERLRQLTGLPPNIIDLVCFSREDRYRVEMQLEQKGTHVLSSSSSKVRVQYDGDPSLLRDLNGVKLVDSVRASLLTHVSLPEAVGALTNDSTFHALTGLGQVIAVADTGLDTGMNDESMHQDLRGRVRHILSWPINTAWSSFINNPQHDDGPQDKGSGHGTHVSGLALGNGSLSQGKYIGVAPKAELVFQAIEQYTEVKAAYRSELSSGYYLSGKPMDLRKLFSQAHELGAKIHVNAWGDPSQGQYTDDSFEVDMFLHEHPDNVILFASGNSGADENGDRLLDEASLYAPASAKNVIAIGATEGSNLGVGLRASWSAFDRDGNRFANEADSNDQVSGDPERIALFSSCGPTLDGRIKPDICAPGTNLAAPRSSMTQEKGWGLASPLPYYMYNGGTSMAVGVAGGAVALLREAWQGYLGGRAPSGVALKALLVYGARPVLNRATGMTEPRNIAGFGRIDVNRSVPVEGKLAIRLHDEVGNGMYTGEQREYSIIHSGEKGFRAVLSWYDPPGERLINDLDLCLLDSNGVTVWGNHLPGMNGQADRINNLEVIDIPNLVEGHYRLRVIAHNIPSAPQDYALAMSVSEPFVEVSIPVQYLKGIGSIYRHRLEQHNVVSVAQISALTREQLLVMTNMKSSSLDLVLARCNILRQMATTVKNVIPESMLLLNLNLLLYGVRPENIALADWNSVRDELISLLLVFNKAALKKIRIHDLL